MQEMDGFQLYQEMKRIDERVKACFLTAADVSYGTLRKEKGFSEFDKDLFLQKPIESTKLISEIRKLL